MGVLFYISGGVASVHINLWSTRINANNAPVQLSRGVAAPNANRRAGYHALSPDNKVVSFLSDTEDNLLSDGVSHPRRRPGRTVQGVDAHHGQRRLSARRCQWRQPVVLYGPLSLLDLLLPHAQPHRPPPQNV